MIKNIILSRKGFDGTNGGIPNPILNSQFIPLPIPEANSKIPYETLRLSNGDSYLKLITDLGATMFTECHLDPDLNPKVLNRSKWIPAFGQCNAAQSRLKKNEVGRNSLFLFYGWFREVTYDNGNYCYVKSSDNIHAIYSYLLVDDNPLDAKEFRKRYPGYKHPHLRGSAFKKLDYQNMERNAIYVGSTETKIGTKPSFGIFEYHEDLILTKKGSDKRSIWELPNIFRNVEISGAIKNIGEKKDTFVFQFKGRNNQELIITDDDKIINWAKDLIVRCNVYA